MEVREKHGLIKNIHLVDDQDNDPRFQTQQSDLVSSSNSLSTSSSLEAPTFGGKSVYKIPDQPTPVPIASHIVFESSSSSTDSTKLANPTNRAPLARSNVVSLDGPQSSGSKGPAASGQYILGPLARRLQEEQNRRSGGCMPFPVGPLPPSSLLTDSMLRRQLTSGPSVAEEAEAKMPYRAKRPCKRKRDMFFKLCETWAEKIMQDPGCFNPETVCISPVLSANETLRDKFLTRMAEYQAQVLAGEAPPTMSWIDEPETPLPSRAHRDRGEASSARPSERPHAAVRFQEDWRSSMKVSL